MRGTDKISGSLFSNVDIEDRIPARHPLRQVKRIVDDAQVNLDAEFDRLYASEGRTSIPPERLMGLDEELPAQADGRAAR